MPATGPDFISFQVRDLDASQAFYEQYLGLVRSQAGPPHAVVFETRPVTFALRAVVPGTDLASVAQPGIGAAIHRSTAPSANLHLRRPRRLPGHSPRPRLTGQLPRDPFGRHTAQRRFPGLNRSRIGDRHPDRVSSPYRGWRVGR
jgi:hypothetical protein